MKLHPRPFPFAALALACTLGPAPAQAQPGGLIPRGDPTKLHPELVKALEAEGRVRAIVRLNVALPEGGELSREVLAAHDARVAEAQAAARAKLRGEAVERAPLRHVPAMVVDGDAEAFLALTASERVTRILLDDLRFPSLTDSLPLVHVPTAWRLGGARGLDSVVGVLDTGFDVDHPFYSDRIVDEACFSDADRDSLCPARSAERFGTGAAAACDPAIDGCDHGTHVAGIAAGADFAGFGFDGVAPAASLALVQVFHRVDSERVCGAGQSPCVTARDSDVLRGLEHMLDLRVDQNVPVKAVNMSLGNGRFTSAEGCEDADPGYEDVVELLNEVGVAVVASSGNRAMDAHGDFVDGVAFPACANNIVSVGAVTLGDVVRASSQAGALLDLVAPGTDIESSVPGGAFGLKSGTSMAAPHVAGAFALLTEMFPSASVALIRATLRETGATVRDARSGQDLIYPRLDVEAAARRLALTWPLPTVPTPTNLRLDAPATRTTATLQWNDSSDREHHFEVVVEAQDRSATFHAQIAPNAFGVSTQLGTVSGLRAGTAYNARVRACDHFERCSAYTSPLAFTTFIQLPQAPAGLRMVSKSTTQITLGWNAQAGLTRYSLNVWGGSVAGSSLSPAAAATSQRVQGRRPNESYHFSLRACNSDGCGPEATLTVRTDAVMAVPAAPTGLILQAAPAGQVSVRYTDNANNEANFEVWRASAVQGFGGAENNPTWSAVASVAANVTSYAGPATPVGGIKYYKVRACNAGGCSGFSNVVTLF